METDVSRPIPTKPEEKTIPKRPKPEEKTIPKRPKQ